MVLKNSFISLGFVFIFSKAFSQHFGMDNCFFFFVGGYSVHYRIFSSISGIYWASQVVQVKNLPAKQEWQIQSSV